MKSQKDWKVRVVQGRHWSVEIAFSTFKRIFGECIHTRKSTNTRQEIFFKVKICDQMIDMAIEAGYV